MKKLLYAVVLTLLSFTAYSQNGLENIIVEKYYISNAADAAGSIGTLPVGSTTYRIYVDLLPGYKFQAAYGVPGHELKISTTTSFFNNEDRGATTPTYSKTNAANNTVMLDSWISCGAACSGNFGILKTADNAAGGTNVVNANGILQNNNANAGIPLITQDGLFAGTPSSVTTVGLSATDLNVFDATSQAGNIFSTTNGSWASLTGSTGPIASSNQVLIGQFTTDGCFSFELNIQIGTPSGGVQQFVARNPAGSEIQLPALLYNTAYVGVTASPSTLICTGTPVTFTATAVNGGTSPVYQWKKNGAVVGTNSRVYTNSALKNNDVITCTLTSNASCAPSVQTVSAPVTMAVEAIPSVAVTTAGPTTFCTGTNALTLNATANPGYSYQWKKGVNNISGAINISYQPTASATYKVLVTTSAGCTKLSPGVVVKVNPLPAASASANGPLTFCAGTTPLTLTANNGNGYTYQWLKGSTQISGANANTYMPTASAAYKVQVTDSNGCSKTSPGITVSVTPLPAATITAGGPLAICSGDSVKLQSSVAAGNSYQWLKGTSVLAGSTSSAYYAKTAGTYKVRVTNTNGCSKTSAGKTVTVNCREGLDATDNHLSVSVYPNPSAGSFVISIYTDETSEVSAGILRIVNMTGQVVYSEKLTEIRNEYEKLIPEGVINNKGLYIVQLETAGNVYNVKAVIE